MFGKQRKVTVTGLLQAAAVLTTVFSLATAYDSSHANIELFAHFRLQYLVVSFLLLIVFAVLRVPAFAILMLAVTIVNASFVVPWYSGSGEKTHESDLRLLHANVLSKNDDYGRLLELVEKEAPDIVLLQEFSPGWQDATKPLQQVFPFSYTLPREGNFGIALFSRLPLESVRHVASPPLGYPTIVATLVLAESKLTIISTHPTIPVTPSLYESRNEQLESVTKLVQESQGAVILIGDFNASLWGRSYSVLEENSGLRNTRQGFGILPTWPTYMPIAMIPIDHALVSDGLEVVELRTGPRIGSDHLPLLVEIAVAD